MTEVSKKLSSIDASFVYLKTGDADAYGKHGDFPSFERGQLKGDVRHD